MPSTPVEVLPDWEMVGDDEPDEGYEPRDRLLATIVVNGCYCHLEAVRVGEREDDGVRYACNPDYDGQIRLAAEINGDGDFETARIAPNAMTDPPDQWVYGDYVIMATSYS